MSMAPTSTMPWMELAPDISGVCSVAGTLLMTSNPTRIASTKTLIAGSSSWLMRSHPPPRVGDDHGAGDLVTEVEIERAVLDHVQEERGDVARVEAAGPGGHRGGQ